MAIILRYYAEEGAPPLSLAAYLKKRGYPAGMISSLKYAGAVRVNGGFRHMRDSVAAGDEITVALEDEQPNLAANPELTVAVLYEDEHLAVVDKPAGMLTHSAAFGLNDALGNYWASRCPQVLFRPIGRLDRNTSGLLIIAQHRLAAALLNGRVDKTYLAVAEGALEQDCGRIDVPLLPAGGQVRRSVADPAGLPSVTHYLVLRRLKAHTYLQLNLETGRTHQIRAHLQYLGHPLAGDTLYGGSTRLIARQALHCATLSFIHPVRGERMGFSAPLPADLARLLADLA